MKKGVLHLISSSGFYGAENVTVNLARETLGSEYQPIIGVFENTTNPHLELAEAARNYGLPIKIFKCKERLDLKLFCQSCVLIKKIPLHLIHSHSYKSNFYGLLASKICNIPIVSTVHGWTRETRALRIYDSLDPVFLRFFDAVVPVSQMLRDELVKRGIPDGKIRLIPNGIDIDRFKPDGAKRGTRVRWGVKEGTFVLGTVGRLNKEKGHTYLIEAMREIIKKHPETVLVIVGDGPLKEELISCTKNNDLKEYVIFTGNQEDMPSIYAMIDLFTLPSLTEGTPLVLLEAMAMQKPIIATKVGGVPQVIRDGETGILVRPGDSVGLAEGILKLLDDSSLASRLGRNARLLVEKEFSAKAMAEKYVRVYDAILNRGCGMK